MTVPVDFTACPRVPGRAYNGANGKKICVAFEGARWMLKFPPPAGERPTALSYTNSCLLPQADEATMRRVLADPAELDARIYVFPASMLKIGGRKINYADFLASSDDPDLAAARARIVPRIDPAAFARLVAETPYLTDLQRAFYTTYFAARASRLFGVPR